MSLDVQLVDGDLRAFNTLVSGPGLVAQRLRIKLATFVGEVIIEKTAGFDFIAWLQQRNPDAAALGALVSAAILATPGVVRVDDFVSDFDTATQTLSFSGTVITPDGAIDVTLSPMIEGVGNVVVSTAIRQGGVAPIHAV